MEGLSSLVRALEMEGPRILSPRRWEHSRRVGEYALFLADHYERDCPAVWAAGLAHDIAREQAPGVLVDWARRDQGVLSPLQLARPVLLHGFAGAWFLRQERGVKDSSFLEAVRHHTLGHPGLADLGLLVCLADYMEPRRPYLTERDRQDLLALPLEKAVKAALAAKSQVNGEFPKGLKGCILEAP